MFKNIKIQIARKKLKKSIIARLDKNVSKEKIKEEAAKIGWPEDIINKIFNEIEEKKKDIVEFTIPLKKREGDKTCKLSCYWTSLVYCLLYLSLA